MLHHRPHLNTAIRGHSLNWISTFVSYSGAYDNDEEPSPPRHTIIPQRAKVVLRLRGTAQSVGVIDLSCGDTHGSSAPHSCMILMGGASSWPPTSLRNGPRCSSFTLSRLWVLHCGTLKKWSHLHLKFVLYVGSITFNALSHFNYVDIITGPNDKIQPENHTTSNSGVENRLMHKLMDQGQAAGRVSGLRQQRRVRDELGRYWVSRQGKKRWKVGHKTEDNLATGTCGCVT